MSHCIEKIAHSCGSSDGLQVFEEDGKYTAYCFACDTYVSNPYGDKPDGYIPKVPDKPRFSVEEDLSEIRSLPSLALEDRKLKQSTLEYFGIKVAVSERDGVTPAIHYYPYSGAEEPIQDGRSFKARAVATKHMWWVGTPKHAHLFGWSQAIGTGSKRLFITEGELDAAALYQALVDNAKGGKWEEYKPAVVSLRNGAGGAKKDLIEHMPSIKATFQEIVLVFDQDEAGKKATDECMQVCPSATSVQLPAKDANACLMEGRAKALCNAVLFRAATPKNTRLVWMDDLLQEARVPPEWGLSWPWAGMTELTRGIRFGETYYLGAGVKMGKSEMVNTLAAHLVFNHGLKVLLAKPEEANNKTVKKILGKHAGKVFDDPKVEMDYDAYDKAAAELPHQHIRLLNLYQHLGWNDLRADISQAVEEGCRAVFIDPITNLVNGISSGETNTILQEIAQELAAVAKDLNIVIFIFCHLKSPDSGAAHERGGKVYSHQFSGSRAMMRSCNLMLGLEGNKDPDLETEQRNMRRLVILEDREFGATGVVNLYWDEKTTLFNEVV